jgi:hypothetical protein
MNVRIRFKDPANPIRYIRGKDLAPHPLNWRTHPTDQLDALKGILADVGIADAVKGFELPDGRVMLIDGHARAEVMPDQEIPVLMLDVTEEEAKKLLAVFDPVGDLAGANAGKLGELLAGVESGNAAVQALLDSLASQHGIGAEGEGEGDGGGGAEPAAAEAVPEKFQVLVILDDERKQAALLERLAGEGYEVRSLIS